jgi:spectinomycin phosphotransferase
MAAHSRPVGGYVSALTGCSSQMPSGSKPGALATRIEIDMLEKPNLQDEKIITCLRHDYGVRVTGISFIPAGNDSSAWVYQVRTDGTETFFLKLKRGTVSEPSVAVPRYLKDKGIEQIVAPLPTKTQALWTNVGQFALILYPFVEGQIGMEIGLSDKQWVEFGAALKNIHSAKLPPGLLGRVPKETFRPKWAGVVKELGTKIQECAFDEPFEKELASFWIEKRQEIDRILDRTSELAQVLRCKPLEFVLCHADIHTANILLDREKRMFIVDWDETVLAPRERDLMFVVGDVAARTKAERLFFSAYGEIDLDPVALAYYRYEWVVQEIGDFGERVFLMADIGAETKTDAVSGFIELFQPGNVVESACKSEDDLPAELKSVVP